MAELTVGPEARGLLARLDGFFRGRGVEAYVVGGFLRDALLGHDSRDLDLSITGDPLTLGPELADALRKRLEAYRQANSPSPRPTAPGD